MKKREIRKPPDQRLGFHTSIAGGISKSVERAVELGCTTMQIFSHNPRQWAPTEIMGEEAERFITLREKNDIQPIYVHASYLINLASRSREILGKSIDFLSYELTNADKLGADYIVLHTGSARDEDPMKARTRAAGSILSAVGGREFTVKILLENTAGERGDITSMVEHLAEIIDKCDCEIMGGICIDTCHAFSAGYDLREAEGVNVLLKEVNAYVGMKMLKLIHVNDSKRPLGSGVDRHEHIGEGYIGIKGLRNILTDARLRNIPMIMETPKKSDEDDRKNLRKIQSILSGK